MSITEDGIYGERVARKIINKFIKPELLLQADWIYKKHDKWFFVEIKRKERYSSPPFDGHGLDGYQVRHRLKLQGDLGLRCMLMVIEKPTDKIYWQWLDWLESNKKFVTKNGVHIYHIDNFYQLNSAEVADCLDVHKLLNKDNDFDFLKKPEATP